MLNQPIGYSLSAEDNDSYMVRGSDADYPACPTCGMPTNRRWINPGFELKKKRYDVSYTYDGYLIASARFVQLIEGRGAVTVELPSTPSHFAVFAVDCLAFDLDRYGTQLQDWCDTCHRYQIVAGATPVLLKNPPASIPNRVFRTDIEFGTVYQDPVVIVGPELGDELRSAKLKGLSLKPIRDDGTISYGSG